MALFRDCQDNGVVSSYNYDAAGRLLDLVHKLNATNVGAFSYTYDNVGNRTSMTDEYGTHSYVYDQLSRLIQATHPQPANPMEQFAYDPVGNRLGGTYDAGNRLLEDADYYYDYDRNGNTTQKLSKTTGELSKLYYDAENQMTKIEKYHSLSDTVPYSTASYIYDGLGRRVAKRVNGVVTKYMYDNEDILLETDVSDSIIARYTHGPGIDEPIIMDRGGSSYYYIADALGSIIKVLDAVGNVINRYVYNSFGSIVDKAETVPNPYTYTGREYDPESGLYYYRFRYYDARVGRFLSEDSIGFLGGVNFYGYAGNNPIIFLDPYGQDPLTVTLITLVASGVIFDMILNIEYITNPCTGKVIARIPPPSMFKRGFPVPFSFGIDIPYAPINLPLIGEIGAPSELILTVDPRSLHYKR